MEQLAPLDENRRYDIPLAAAYLGISRAKLYEKLAAGELQKLKDGRRTYIPGSEIARVSRVQG